ncbi:hypothetical protein KIN20_007022 [Parelaphostrongylus tenuis]|uniref:Peptidase S1 domain-containing protein n=1 Tax=Parelaphostrongylus tenuis TaxID=148309 RepID=A0AAD5M759_PARTN|nr:hypothetical protein KIN20_007022 [Parelaphostrongylus tenuis]
MPAVREVHIKIGTFYLWESFLDAYSEIATLPTFRFLLEDHERENKYLKAHCGAHFLEHSSRYSRSTGGVEANQYEYPWMAALINRPFFNGQYRSGKLNACSAVEVSKRHFLTAAHCVVEYSSNLCKQSTRHIYSVGHPKSFTIFINSACTNPGLCQKNVASYSVVKVTVHKNYNPCTLANDIAIVEVSRDVSEKHGSPICMPKPNERLQSKLKAIGFGPDPTSPLKREWILSDLRSLDLTTVEGIGKLKKTVVTSANDNHTITSGDSGGPIVQANGQKYTVEGIASRSGFIGMCFGPSPYEWENFPGVYEYLDRKCTNPGIRFHIGPICTKKGSEEGKHSIKITLNPDEICVKITVNVFTDVRGYLNWICAVNGIMHNIKKRKMKKNTREIS